MIVQYIVCECGRRGLVEWNTANVDQVTIDVASGAIHQECPVCRRDAALRRAPYRGLDDIRRDSQEDRVPEASVEDGAPGVSGPGEVLSPEPVGGETYQWYCTSCGVWRKFNPCGVCGAVLNPAPRGAEEWFCFTCQNWRTHDPCEGCREERKPL